MSYRKHPIVKGEIYHVFNRSIAKQSIFLTNKDYLRAMEVILFYRFINPPMRFSFYNRLPSDQKVKLLAQLQGTALAVEIICFCLMPNHFHFLLKNVSENGIGKFISNLQNSYAKYFNTKEERSGSLFQQNYKAVRIESDEQLFHVSRYIHLNPVTSYIINEGGLKTYGWSSYPDYLKGISDYLNLNLILDNFVAPNSYEKFVLDQVDYQRKLDAIKHLRLE